VQSLAAPRARRYTSARDGVSEQVGHMLLVLHFISELITLYIYVVFASVILSWLMNFGIVNPQNPYVRGLSQALMAVTEPLLSPIRRMIPDLGAIDISPIVLLLGCQFVQVLLATSRGSFICTYASICG
jgi:YggT family protein